MSKPLHISISERLSEMIFSGDYTEGDQLPTEPSLAKTLGVSRATLREALKHLEMDGILYRRHGIGTFVKSKAPAITLDLSIPLSITAMIESLGFVPGTEDMEVVTEVVFPDDVERLKIEPGSKVFRITRIRTANSQPVAYTIDIVPYWVMKKYPQWESGSNFSLIEHLTYRCGIELKETSSILMPLHDVRSVAGKLGIDASSHIFFSECVDYTTDNTPVLFSREYFSPWIFRFSVRRKPLK
ncbi:MAG: GntR family transcriptional regulator [Candidatus Latescibacteria bacterium]|jgi:GntR family transcriptional regulator|nr:GntR family transcriptional regulator [Candidatus Latescibacterota bacterium]